MAKYPFLPQAKDHIAKLGIDFADIVVNPAIRKRAKERVLATFDLVEHYREAPGMDVEVEVVSFPVAVLYVGSTGERSLMERFALFEAKQIRKYLESERDDVIIDIARFFGWDIERTEYVPRFSVNFVHYLRNTTRGRLVHEARWRLVNRQVANGRVYVTREEVCRLLQEEARAYIERRVGQEVGNLPKGIQDDINEIRIKYAESKPHLEAFDQIVRAEESDYPPCVKSLLERATKGQHLSHVERFTLVTYLIHQGIGVDAIVKLFSNVSDFKEDKTRYQVEHLAGLKGSRTAYKTYSCSTLRTHGVCTNPDDPICRRIKNPLTYHLKKRK